MSNDGSGFTGGVTIVDVRDPGPRPFIVGKVSTPGWSVRVAMENDVVCVAEGRDGLPLIDVSSCTCPADLDDSDDVGLPDLIQVLASWGDCVRRCPADLDHSDDIGLGDLLIVLASWGPCGG